MIKSFRKFAIITVSAVIFLIFVGGFVRATGSGMGCPDWPKCFGMWIPPTSVEQLPANYQEIFGAKLKGEVEFNATKTWTEYVNRLVGVTVGFTIFITLILSYRAYFKQNRIIFYICLAAFLLVSFQGWLGAKVVSSELSPGMITLHMVIAVVILGLLIWAVLKSYGNIDLNISKSADIRFLLFLVLSATIAQIIFGTQIREGIDISKKLLGEENRELWIDSVRGKVIFHAVVSFFILALQWIVYKRIKERVSHKTIVNFAFWAFAVCLVEITTGSILALAGFPAMLQPLHLTFSVVIVSIQFVLYFVLNPTSNERIIKY